jgi:hypothetical protein
MPVLTIPQDLGVLSPPDVTKADPDAANLFDAGFPHLKLVFGVPDSEKPCATGQACSQSISPGAVIPYHFQLDNSGIQVWQNAAFDAPSQTWKPLMIPEGGGVPMLWPVVILSKLVDNQPDATTGVRPDPASVTAQGDAKHPVIILQGITLLQQQQKNPFGGNAEADTILNTALGGGTGGLLPAGLAPNTIFDRNAGLPCAKYDTNNNVCTQYGPMTQDHLTVALRPSVICFNHLFDSPPPVDTRGVLVSPYSTNAIASVSGGNIGNGPVVPRDLLNNVPIPGADGRFQVTNLVKAVQYGCLPKGRYAINVVYPDGQAWTVPNESGACVGGTEGTTDYGGLTCTLKSRPVLPSQGNRAVVEIVGPANAANCQTPNPAAPGDPATLGDETAFGKTVFAVPPECQPTSPSP